MYHAQRYAVSDVTTTDPINYGTSRRISKEPGTIGRVQRRAPASLILWLSGFLGLCEASTIGVLRNLAALLRRYQLQRRTFVPEFAGSVGSLGIFLLHSLIASAFLGGFPPLDEKNTLARFRSKNAHVTSPQARLGWPPASWLRPCVD